MCAVIPTIEQFQLSRLFSGAWESAGLDCPQLAAGDRAMLVERLYERADLWYLCDGRHLAVALGYEVGSAPLRLCGGGATRGSVILYDPSLSLLERSLACFHEVAHGELKREGWTSVESDAWLLTVDLVMPPEARRLLSLERVTTEAHAPAWFVQAAIHSGLYLEHFRTTLRPEIAYTDARKAGAMG